MYMQIHSLRQKEFSVQAHPAVTDKEIHGYDIGCSSVVERSLPTPDVRGSNPVTDKFYILT